MHSFKGKDGQKWNLKLGAMDLPKIEAHLGIKMKMTDNPMELFSLGDLLTIGFILTESQRVDRRVDDNFFFDNNEPEDIIAAVTEELIAFSQRFSKKMAPIMENLVESAKEFESQPSSSNQGNPSTTPA